MKRRETPFIVRHHMSLGADYALQLIRIFTDLFDGDLGLAMVFIAAAQAGTQHLRQEQDYPDITAGDFFPDDLRRPVSISALARSLGLPVETTRRHVVKLAANGYALRTEGGGVIITSAILQREEIRQTAGLNAANMAQLIDGLKRTPGDR
jgi:hypothetical protein